MLNLKSVEYTMCFLTNADFNEDAEIAIFKSIFKRLKSILCINIEGKCISCSHNDRCLYNFISAKDFMAIDMMPIIIRKPLISKKHFIEGNRMKLKFIFLGNAALHLDFIDYILREFEVNGLFKERYRFVIENRFIQDITMEDNHTLIDNIEVLTPIDRIDDIFSYEKEKLERLNTLYNIIDKPLSSIDESYDKNFIKFNNRRSLYLGSNRIRINGYIGKISFNKSINVTPLLSLIKNIGAGKFYGIGGGVIELK